MVCNLVIDRHTPAFSILCDHELLYMEDVWFTSAPNLTVSTVEVRLHIENGRIEWNFCVQMSESLFKMQLLMDRCPALQSIGQLSGWSLMPDDVALLRGLLKSANSALVLSPTSIFP